MSLDNMMEKFRDSAELQAFCNTQQSLIIKMGKQISELENEKNHLKRLLESSVPIFSTMVVSEEEQIAREQLRRLNEFSKTRELTLEETRKCEIFNKIMTSVNSKPKVIENSAQSKSDSELLKLVSDE